MLLHRFRSIFISDVHLGTPDCKAAYQLDASLAPTRAGLAELRSAP